MFSSRLLKAVICVCLHISNIADVKGISIGSYLLHKIIYCKPWHKTDFSTSLWALHVCVCSKNNENITDNKLNINYKSSMNTK